MARLCLLLPLFLLISGCGNLYSICYEDFTEGKNILEDSQVAISMDEPKLRQGFDSKNDTRNMLENGYRLLGQSSFYSRDESQNGAVAQAKKVHADTVIVYRHYSNTVSGMRPLIVPNMQYGTTYHSGTIYGSGGDSASYFGSSSTTTYGTSTTYVPYQIDLYDYLATYWVKIKFARLGIYFDDLTEELRKKVGSNKVYITIVVKDSPAFNSDLLVNDIINRVNGIEVIDSIQFQNWLNETHPSEIEFEIFRNGEYITKRVQPQY